MSIIQTIRSNTPQAGMRISELVAAGYLRWGTDGRAYYTDKGEAAADHVVKYIEGKG